MPSLPRVLVVDDNAGDLTLLHEAVADTLAPLQLTTCACARQALDMVTIDPNYALILSDINMPGMTGIEFLRALTQMPRASTIPVVLMSSSTRDAMPATLSGAVRQMPYFTKPSDWRGFRDLAQRLVSVARECGTSEDAGEVLGAHVRPSARLPTPTPPPRSPSPSGSRSS